MCLKDHTYVVQLTTTTTDTTYSSMNTVLNRPINSAFKNYLNLNKITLSYILHIVKALEETKKNEI